MPITHPHVVSNPDDVLLWNKKGDTRQSQSTFTLIEWKKKT